MKKKTSMILFIIFIVSISTCGLSGCVGELVVDPIDNSELIKSIKTVVWDEGAKKYDNGAYNNPSFSVNELKTGTPSARYAEITFECASNKFDGYEFYFIKFDIMADRDVRVILDFYYGFLSEKGNLRHSITLNLRANEKQALELNLNKNFTMANGDSCPYIKIMFKGRPASDSMEFREWSQTEYVISNFELYAEKPE